MGSTTCSDLGFVVLQPSCRIGKLEKRQFLYASRGIVHPKGTDQNSNDKSLDFFLTSVTLCQHWPRCVCCSACEAVFLALRVPRAFLRVPRAFLRVPRPFLSVPRAFLRVPRSFVRVSRAFLRVPRAFLFKAPNAVDWLQWLTGSAGVSIGTHAGFFDLNLLTNSRKHKQHWHTTWRRMRWETHVGCEIYCFQTTGQRRPD